MRRRDMLPGLVALEDGLAGPTPALKSKEAARPDLEDPKERLSNALRTLPMIRLVGSVGKY